MKKLTSVLRVYAIVLLASLSALMGCQGKSKQVMTIRYGGQHYPGDFLLKGYPQLWEKYGLSVEHTLFGSATESNEALAAGDLDINVGSASKAVELFNAIPERALIIATVQRGARYSTVVRADSPYQTWEDLRGKKVAVRLGGTGAEQVLLRYFDQSEELNWDDFEWVDLKIEEKITALSGGSIEAFTAWEPTPAIAETQGVGRVIHGYGGMPALMFTTVEYAEKNRKEIVKFLAARLDGVEIIRAEPQRAAQLVAKGASEQGIDVSADAFKKVFERVNFSPEIDSEVLALTESTARFLHERGKIDTIPKLRWDSSFLEEAKKLRAGK